MSITPTEASLTAIACAVVFMAMIVSAHLGRQEAQKQCRAYEYSRTAMFTVPFKGTNP